MSENQLFVCTTPYLDREEKMCEMERQSYQMKRNITFQPFCILSDYPD